MPTEREIDRLIEQNKLSEALAYLNSINSDFSKARKVHITRTLGNLNEALLAADTYLKDITSVIHHAELLIEKAYCYWAKGEYVKGNEILSLLEPEIDRFARDNTYLSNRALAMYYHISNNILYNWELPAKTRPLLFKAIYLWEKIDDKKYLAIAYNNLAVALKYENKLDEALEYLFKSLEIQKLTGNMPMIALNYTNIGEIYVYQGDEIAADEIRQKMKEILIQSPDDPFINIYYHYMEGYFILSKSKQTFKELVQAGEEFQTILNMECIQPQYYYNSMFYLCSLYLKEMQLLRNPDLLGKIEKLINKIIMHGEKEDLIQINIKANLLKSQLFLMINHIEDAEKLLLSLISTADNKDEFMLSKLIKIELNNLNAFRSKLKSADDVYERFKYTNFDGLIRKFIYPWDLNPTNREEVPVLLIIMTLDGIEVYSYEFSTELIKPQLISSFLSAIISFASNMFSEDYGQIERINLLNHEILLKREDYLTYCYIFKGLNSSFIIDKLNKFINIVELRFEHKDFRSYVVMDHEEIEALNEFVETIFGSV
ncbi:MAG: tetratricopeptide repeat protein [Candidatus Heimdallarchaeota archaeon]|nr:tetratricopeptide repeat protein [Candidatus Heimdallarchaeota archaeon]